MTPHFPSPLPAADTPATGAFPSSTPSLPPAAESLFAIILRRARYVIAIIAGALVFSWLAWRSIAPPADYAGISLLAWPNAAGFLATLILLVVLILVLFLCMLLTHPDSPHTGLYCTFLGLAWLAIKGGNIHLLLRHAQDTAHLTEVRTLLSLECILWALLLIAAEFVTRLLFTRLFANTRWLERTGLNLHHFKPSRSGFLAPLIIDQSKFPLHTPKTKKPEKTTPPLLLDIGAFLLAIAIAIVLLSALLQSQQKGQVLFAALVSFGLAAFVAHVAFPTCSTWPLWLAVPAVAAIAPLWPDAPFRYPGFSPTPLGRALPIDYLTAGLPGAILGYYAALRLHLHNLAAEHA